MRLSRAIAVMLLLHVVAVGGFFASSVLKEKDLKRSSSDPATAMEAEESHVPSKGQTNNATKRVPSTENVHVGTHVVRPGETLTLIANENGVTLEALVAANGADTVTSGLRAGQELKLPDKSPEPVAPVSDNTASALKLIEARPVKGTTMPPVNAISAPGKGARSSQETYRTYVVAKGDNASSISQKNKVNYEALLKLNQIDDPKKIHPGQKLRLPSPPSKTGTTRN